MQYFVFLKQTYLHDLIAVTKKKNNMLTNPRNVETLNYCTSALHIDYTIYSVSGYHLWILMSYVDLEEYCQRQGGPPKGHSAT